MTIDVSMWSGAVGELSSYVICYKQYYIGSCIIMFVRLTRRLFILFLFYVLIMVLMYCDLHA